MRPAAVRAAWLFGFATATILLVPAIRQEDETDQPKAEDTVRIPNARSFRIDSCASY